MKVLSAWKTAMAALALSMPTLATAQQVLLAGDTYVNSAAPTNNYSNLATVSVSSTTPALLKFDIADVLPAGTTAAQLSNAKLILYLDNVTTTGSFDIYQVTSNWGEHSVTYNTKPTISGTKAGGASANGTGSYSAIDLSALVRTWITTPSSNFGIELQSVGATSFAFDSKENTTTSHQAVLQLVLASGPAGPQGPAGPAGPKGSTGPAGPTGATGPTGTLTFPFVGSATTSDPMIFLDNDGTGGGLFAFGGYPASTSGAYGGYGVYGEGGPTLGTYSYYTIGGYGVEGRGGPAAIAGDFPGTGGYFIGGAPQSGGLQGEGLYAAAGTGNTYAGDFAGDVYVSGNLSKSGGSFQIDHPLDPENKYLYHSFVESPDMKNVYDGTIVTDGSGTAIVTLPDWFESLNRDFRYQLTTIGQPARAWIASKVARNQFVIRTDKGNVEVSWQVTGIRQDAWANAHRIPVEQDKSERERGHYIHPELFGHAGEPNVQEVLHPRPKLAAHTKQ